jgi:hypothetical protein
VVLALAGFGACGLGATSEWLKLSAGFSLGPLQLYPNETFTGLSYPGSDPKPGVVCLIAAAIAAVCALIAQVPWMRIFACFGAAGAVVAGLVAWEFRTHPPDIRGQVLERSGIESIGVGTTIVVAGAGLLGVAMLLTLFTPRNSRPQVVYHVNPAIPGTAGQPVPMGAAPTGLPTMGFSPPGSALPPPPTSLPGEPARSAPARRSIPNRAGRWVGEHPARFGAVVSIASAAVVLLVVEAVGVQTNSSDHSGSPAAARPTTSTIAAAAIDCVTSALSKTSGLADQAQADHQSHENQTISVGGDTSYLHYGQRLSAIALSDCPADFEAAFARYSAAWLNYGQWLDNHTGAGGLTKGSDRSGEETRAQAIRSSVDKLSGLAGRYAPNSTGVLTISSS